MSSPPTCRYFLQGTCKFGSQCRFSHPGNQDKTKSRQGVSPLNAFGSPSSVTPTFDKFSALSTHNHQGNIPNVSASKFSFTNPSNVSASKFSFTNPSNNTAIAPALSKTIKELTPQELGSLLCDEMKSWITSHMWPFSCFALGKESPCLFEFEDFSQEELRLEAYEAEKNGEMEKYKSKVADMYREVQQKMDSINLKARDMNWVINNVKNNISAGCIVNRTGNLVNNEQSTFSPSTPIKNPAPLFGQNNSSSVFGNQSITTSFNNGGFNVNNCNNQNSSKSIFGNNQSNNSPGQSNLNSFSFKQSSVFDANNSNQSSNSSVFGGGFQSNQSNTSQINQTSNFSSINLGNQANSSVFGNINSPLSDTSNTNANVQKSQSINKNALVSKDDFTVYTKIEDLTENEKNQFSAKFFTLGNIPTRPPARELCF